MRRVGEAAILLVILVALLATSSVVTAECLYYPQCTEYNYDVCGTCQRARYATACNGYCDYTSWQTCQSYLPSDCNQLGDMRTIACATAGQVKDQTCSQTTCDWVDTSVCYLDPDGDPDGDGVPTNADDCPTTYAGSDTCNGCPNPVCDGCLTWPSACPQSGPRLCTLPDDTQCSDYTCQNGCVGNNWCIYSGGAVCSAIYGSCTCPSPSCTYSTSCDLDDDNDGVPDANDMCPNTVLGQAVDFSGCSCAQKICDDNKECTTDTCSAAQCVYTPKTTGTICNYLGDGTPNDGLCDASGTCVQSASCTATPGCRTAQPSYSHTVTGTCTAGQTCYACDSGYTWNPTTGACEAPSCHVCETGQRKCASAGTSYYTCATNAQGCRVWTTTTANCDTADCTSYTCTPGTAFTGSCTATPKTDGSPCSTGTCIGGECTTARFTNIENSYSITSGTSYTFTPIPNLGGASFNTSGTLANVSYFTTSFTIATNIAQVRTAAYQQIIKMFIGANEVASKTFSITVTCSQGDACYCPSGMKTGCGNPNQNSTAMQTRYCPDQKTCVNCDSTTVFNPAPGILKCTQCNTSILTNCPPGNDCQTAVCTTSGSCGFSNKGSGTPCNGGAGTCDGQGNCNGCDPILCANRNTSTLINESSETIGCKNLTQQRNTTSLYACSGTNCAVTSTKTEYQTITTYLQNGAQCMENGKTGTCANNVCIPYGCQNDGDCTDPSGCQLGTCNASTHQCSYNTNPNACNSVKWNEQPSCAANIFICDGTIECTRTVIDTTCTAANITAGLCKPSDTTGYKCIARCPSGSDIPGCAIRAQTNYTNANMIPTMYSCSGASSCYMCEENHVYYEDDDKCYPAEYTMSFTANNAIATEQTIVTPILKDGSGALIKNRDHSFQFRLTNAEEQLYTYDTFSFSMERPGMYPTTITALRNGVPVASKTDDLPITCLPGPCCESGATASKPDGAACQEQVQAGVFVSGRCKAAACVLACTVQSAKETGKDGGGKDRCNNGIDDDCDGKYDCNDPDCSSVAVCTTTCSAGQLICGGSCTDTTADNTHCGDCNRPCKPNEQCTQGACIAMEDCSIVCNKDRDCRSGEVCINPGDCSRSYCAPADAVVANETKIVDIMRTIAESKTYGVLKEIVGNRIIIRITNLAPVPLQNVTVTVNINFPKEMVASASDLGADLPFSVIEDDPVIAFDIAEIKDYRTITIELPNTIDPAMEQSVYVSAVHNPITGIADALDNDKLTITSNILKEDGKTTLLIGLDPHAKLTGVRIPVEIPKCVAQSAKELYLDGDYEIIQDDPLIVWTFDSLSAKQNIEIGMGDRELAEDCKNGITAFAVATGVDRPLNPWLPLLAIPILGIIIIFFQRFRADDVEERIGKEEFERLARDQGKSEEEIREAWDTYERKF